MNSYIISCCSTADITAEHFKKINVSCASFHFLLDDRDCIDDLGQSMPYKEFYAAMKNGADTKTSQISVGGYIDYFTPFLKDGHDVIHLCLSSGISGSYRSALSARDILAAEFPERKLIIIDSLSASSGTGLLVDMAASLRDEGYTIEELQAWIEENKLRLHHWFFSTDLTFYVKGGRISKAAGLVGGLLNICPLLFVNSEGKLIPFAKIRTKQKVLKAIVEKMEEHADGGLDYNGKCFVSHSDSYDDACILANMIEERFPNLKGKILINYIGTTIGSHSGPGTVAVFFMGDDRRNISI